METSLYTLLDLSNHKSKTSAWVLIDGVVYDVTKYLDEHPGGTEILLEHAGQDATKDFQDIGHSHEARNKMKEFAIGKIKEVKQTSDSDSSNTPSRSKCHCEIM